MDGNQPPRIKRRRTPLRRLRTGWVPAALTRRASALATVQLPAWLTIAVGLLLATRDGGYAGATWYPAALFLLALLALTLSVAPPLKGEWTRSLSFALLALGALFVLALVSTSWSDVPGASWDGANKILLYGIVLAVVTLRPWPARAYAVALGLVAAGTAAIALGLIVVAAGRVHPADLFIGGRLSAPVGYPNATAGLWLIGLWPAVAMACHRGLHWAVRSAFFGVSCVLLEISLLSVSRGAVGAVALVALLFIAIMRVEWPALLAVVAVGAVALLASGPVLAVSAAPSAAALEHALPTALATIVWTSVLVACVAALALTVGARAAARLVEPDARRAWPGRAKRLVGVLAGVAVVAALVSIGNPADWVSARWTDFKTSGYTQVHAGSARLTGSLGSGRYDFYRVALDEFRAHPIAGIGYENFQVPYLVDRRTDEAPRYTHGLAFAVLAQLGILGAALLLAFLAQMLALARRALAAASDRRILVAGALAGFGGWFVHGLVDWLWEFPALGILAFSLLGLAARGCPRGEPAESAAPQEHLEFVTSKRHPGRALRVTSALAALAAAGSFATLGIAARLTDASFEVAGDDPSLAIARLDRASRLDVLSAAPLLSRGILERRVGDPRRAEASFQSALRREPRNWFAQLELGMTLAARGRRQAALDHLGRAERLNPRQPLVDEVRRSVERRQVVDPAAVERTLSADQQSRLSNAP